MIVGWASMKRVLTVQKLDEPGLGGEGIAFP
jgi:hypothetical protein